LISRCAISQSHMYVSLYGCLSSDVFSLDVSCIFSQIMFSFVVLFSRVHSLLNFFHRSF
jgi:hypothetical protein